MEFTTTGLKIDTQADIFNKISANLNIALTPYLNGTTLRTDEASALGRIIRAFSKPMGENNEIMQSFPKQFDINQAEGDQLDHLASVAYRKKRKDMALAFGFVVVYGDSGVTVPKGSYASNSVTGDIFSTQKDITFDLNDVCGITFAVNEIKDQYRITYSITGLISQSPTVIVDRVGETNTSDMAQRIANSINSQSTVLKATYNNDNTVTILLSNQRYHSDFGLPDGLILTQSYKVVDVKAETYQSAIAEPNTVTVKKSSVQGWRGVYNPSTINSSTGIENDSDFKERLNTLLGNSTGTFDSIYARLYAVKGVSFVNIKVNSSSNTVSNITNNGLAISILGGDEDEIALALSECVSSGIATVGTITKVVYDINNGQQNYSFSRPEIIDLTMKMQITQYKNFPTNGKQLIKQAVVDYFNTMMVGQAVQYSRLYTPINTVAGFSVSNLVIGKSGEDLSQDNIFMSFNQVARLSADNILIGGS
jgi:uncharacterized phage protein gp47/JayE